MTNSFKKGGDLAQEIMMLMKYVVIENWFSIKKWSMVQYIMLIPFRSINTLFFYVESDDDKKLVFDFKKMIDEKKKCFNS